MNTLTQAPTGTAIVQQAKALKGSTKAAPKAPATKKPVEQAPVMAPWYAVYNARITDKKGELGTPITPDEALMGAAIGGPEGRPKRTTGDACEALWLALTLRPGGCRKGDYITIKGSHGYAMNALYHAGDTPSAKREPPLYRWVHVTQGLDGAYVSRLTPKGRAYGLKLGIKAAVLDRMAKPYEPKAAKPAKARNGASKPKGKGAAVQATPVAATPSKPTSEAPKPAEGHVVTVGAVTEPTN